MRMAPASVPPRFAEALQFGLEGLQLGPQRLC
jgi:hypothetical protein